MKKPISCLLCAVCICTLAGCASTGAGTSKNSDENLESYSQDQAEDGEVTESDNEECEYENDYVAIKQYKGVKVPEPESSVEVTDDDIDEYIDEEASESIGRKKVDDAKIKDGDTVEFTYQDDGEDMEYEAVVGDGDFYDGFDDAVTGHKSGDTFSFTSEDEDPETLDITITAVYEPQDYEITDEWVQTVSDTAKTVDEYRSEVMDILAKDYEEETELELEMSAWDVVLDGTTLKKYDEDKVSQSYEETIKLYQDMADEEGVSLEDLAVEVGFDGLEELQDAIMEDAKLAIEEVYVAEAIMENEGLEVDDKDGRTATLAEWYGYDSVDDLKADYSDEEIEDQLKINVAEEFVAANCVTVSDEDDAEADEGEYDEDDEELVIEAVG